MRLEQSFTVRAPVERVWSALIDPARVAPCLPGAEITEAGEDGTYKGTFQVKLGPTTASYRGTLRMESLDEREHRATMSGVGQDKRGQGSAKATIVSTMTESAGETRVDVVTDFTITGRLARFGRGGMIEDISNRLLREFADCLQARIESEGAAGDAQAEPATVAAAADRAADASAGPNGGRTTPAPEPAVASGPRPPAPAASAAGTAEAPARVAPAEIQALRGELSALRREVEALKAKVNSRTAPDPGGQPGAQPPAKAKPIGAFGLLFSVLRDRLKRRLGRG